MKKILLTVFLMTGIWSRVGAMEVRQDTVTNNVRKTIDYIYETVIPMLDRVEIDGNSEASRELRKRWGWIVDYIKNNKESMFHEVKKLMVTPTGKTIDIETIKNFINISERDSVKKVTVNPGFILNELKVLGDKLNEAGVRMAEQK